MDLERHSTGGYVHPSDPGESGYPSRSKRVSVTDAEAAILAREFAGMVVLEIGTGLGVSTRAIASAALRVTTVDPDPWVAENIAAGLPRNVCLRKDVPTDALRGMFGGVFVDGHHTFDSALADFRLARGLHPEKIIAHDWAGEVKRAGEGAGLAVADDYGTPLKLVRLVPA